MRFNEVQTNSCSSTAQVADILLMCKNNTGNEGFLVIQQFPYRLSFLLCQVDCKVTVSFDKKCQPIKLTVNEKNARVEQFIHTER